MYQVVSPLVSHVWVGGSKLAEGAQASQALPPPPSGSRERKVTSHEADHLSFYYVKENTDISSVSSDGAATI